MMNGSNLVRALVSWLILLVCVEGFSKSTVQSQSSRVETRRNLFNLLEKTQPSSTENGLDPEYPWSFTGRLWFRPALTRVPSGPNDPRPPSSVTILNLFGWTLGGTVALEYDESPVGPYKEYVTMGAAVFKRGAIGQWGSKLFVSTQPAEDVCRKTWSVPAALANIDFGEDSTDSLTVQSAPGIRAPEKQNIRLSGWKNARILGENPTSSKRFPAQGLPVLWTPSIKALWTPFVPLPLTKSDTSKLPLHRLRLSASAIRLTICAQKPSDGLGIPIPIGLLVDNVLIEISRQQEEPL
ncbi:unnamed protein product [Cylindrotheca closterium]|uniref:Uncharacterized protein n=1 Tax=Cylindrotheca closterium TaxID=2856 RepID=A0AAD2JIF2_9STRA|nr:unnamed protein product [Cylindrotheca closterium]